ncbi:hypothetical protein T492DRAFT_1041003 [Pavlovales sp. CCMP2436]|nr:hypothetical protein T492DRAFT_1041003 [Pavlovales sp. CCMP2436]
MWAGLEEEHVHMIKHDAALTLVIMTAVLLPMLALERARRVDNKAVSYAMSLCTSLAMTTAGFVTVLPAFAESGFDVSAMVVDTRYARFVSTFFATFCLLDLVYGKLFYPKQIDLLTGWVHHIVYMWLMYHIHVTHTQGSFALFLIEELPTFLLALGNVSRKLRTNLLFGAAFFATRIAWHSFMLHHFWAARKAIVAPLWPFIALTLVLHLHWLYGYLLQQRKRLRKRAASKSKPE